MSKSSETPKTVFRKDYKNPDFDVETVELRFDLNEDAAIVTNLMHIRRTNERAELCLDGDPEMALLDIVLDGVALSSSQYDRQPDRLTIFDCPDVFDLCIKTRIQPEKNTRLEGLYKSGGMYCTQCEAEGFRNITFFLDRPDVMARYRVRIEASKADCPVLLSNGNRIDAGDLDNGRHYAVWEDPFPKPSYLFALVAGDLSVLSDSFETRSGKKVALNIYAAKQDIPKCHHAMESLKKAMQWDEDTHGLEYDLDVYNIVAVGDFNMGAMENKGLNIFNTKFVLADELVATDDDFDKVEGVIGHEYFHNWSGNRVTCRDWFQLSLKEGLTVYRDQEFSADQGSRAVKRIQDVRLLRSHQFIEDAGPMAHPVRPDSYMEINNFYTATVYNKGAEVIRMIHRILGERAYKKGLALYFQRHDGQAVTCDDFVQAMEDASGIDLGQFRLWYEQAGTPKLELKTQYDAQKEQFDLHVTQKTAATPGQVEKKPLHIPFLMELLGDNGAPMKAELLSGTGERKDNGWLLHIKKKDNHFRFQAAGSRPPVPSLLRDFSAPVTVKSDLTYSDRLFLIRQDQDSFNRWDVCQTLLLEHLLCGVEAIQKNEDVPESGDLINVVSSLLEEQSTDRSFLAEMVKIPTEAEIGQQMSVIAVDEIYEVRNAFAKELADKLRANWQKLYDENQNVGCAEGDKDQRAKRAIKNVALGYLVKAGAFDLALHQLETAQNMTDRLGAFNALIHHDVPQRTRAIERFYNWYKDEPLALDKWFAVQALSRHENTTEDVLRLSKHKDFNLKNPNRLRSLAATFSALNQTRFHDLTGKGYAFLADIVLMVDRSNPQIAARLMAPLIRYKRFERNRSEKMQSVLQDMMANHALSENVYEIVQKSLI